MKIELSVTDSISPMIKDMLATHKAWLRGTTKSVGWWIQKTTKEEVKAGAPGGIAFKKRTPWKRVRKALQPKAPHAWYGRMRQAIGYEYKDGTVDIGWTSPTSAWIGRWQENGLIRKVDDFVRRKFAGAGIPLSKGKKQIVLPERNIFDPMAREMFPQLPSYVEKKAMDYMNGKVQRGISKRRTYKVYKA